MTFGKGGLYRKAAETGQAVYKETLILIMDYAVSFATEWCSSFPTHFFASFLLCALGMVKTFSVWNVNAQKSSVYEHLTSKP